MTPILQTKKLRFREEVTCPGPDIAQPTEPGLKLSTLATSPGLSFFLCIKVAEWMFDWRTEGKGLAGVTRARCMINVCRVEVGYSSCLLVVSFLAGQLSSPT